MPQCVVVLFEIRIWKAFLVMVCSPVKLSSSASLRNRVVIPGNVSKFENFPKQSEFGVFISFPGAFCNYVMRSPQNDILKCHIVLNPPKLGNRTQFCA